MIKTNRTIIYSIILFLACCFTPQLVNAAVYTFEASLDSRKTFKVKLTGSDEQMKEFIEARNSFKSTAKKYRGVQSLKGSKVYEKRFLPYVAAKDKFYELLFNLKLVLSRTNDDLSKVEWMATHPIHNEVDNIWSYIMFIKKPLHQN